MAADSIEKVLQDAVAQAFPAYIYPERSADEEIANMDKADQESHALYADAILKNPAWKIEFGGFLRTMFYELAFVAKGETLCSQVDAYRLSVLFFKRFEKRLADIASKKELLRGQIRQDLTNI